ncbi:MAG: acyltransferase [Anaerolineales bacterium]|nr:acyltransferase [Anaerolineales bacterium]
MKNSTAQRFAWLEAIKAIAILWVFVNHVAEPIFGVPLIGNPLSGWLPLSDRISQLYPLDGFGAWNIPLNILRYVGWFGDQGVQLFLIASGFGLTWGLLNRQAEKPIKIVPFYLNRARRIYPIWWGVHVLFIGTWFVTGWGLSLFEPATWLSFLGIRLTPELLYYFSPAWWYFWLIVQLYLIYPFLWNGLRKWGPLKLLLWSSVIAFALRGVGLFVFDSYLDAWSRGAIFITRLPEFVFGISLASWMFSHPEETHKRLSSWRAGITSIAVYLIGIYLALTLPGMIFAPFLFGVSIFVLLYAILNKLLPLFPRWLRASTEWTGKHSYSLYLIHHPVILALISYGAAISVGTFGRAALAFILMLVLGPALEWGVDFAQTRVRRLWEKFGTVRLLLASGLVAVTMILILIGAELAVRRFDPQEVRGWGERPALEMDSQFGWKLIPSQTTRLRWLSYDYAVTSNSLGFPAPEYPEQKPDDVYRILVTGDAFSSAEGVDTDRAWPRLLESRLNEMAGGKKIQVLNFSMTGYGPNQYAEVVKEFAPLYQPDLILIEVFVNDFQDALWTNEDFQYNIGFYNGDADSLSSILKLESLRSWTDLNIKQKLQEILQGEPNAQGYFLGHFATLERSELETMNYASDFVKEELGQIQTTAEGIGAQVILVMAPSSVQVCSSDELDYYPRHIDLADSTRFNPDQPQRIMSEIAEALDLPMYDLRNVLSSSEQCPYQPRNMHWTADGHRVVADYLADLLIQNGYVP